MVRTIAVLIAFVSLARLSAQTVRESADGPPLPFPVTRVVLYKSGVGYFEHLGNVTGNQQLVVEFTGSQLDDVLKSLTAVDLAGGRVAAVTYESPTPIERRLQALRLPLGQRATTLDVLTALRGTQIEVRPRAGGVLTGRLLNVERRTRLDDGRPVDLDELALLTDQGQVVTVELGAGTAVRVADVQLRRDLNQYLDVATSATGGDSRRMVVTTSGTGVRPLFVSYTSEAAVWKTTYRLVFPTDEDRSPLLQGWAIVDNMGAQDWQNVELSLVAGAPQSFVQPLSRPLFARRPVVSLPTGLLPTPQRHDPALVSSPSALPPPPPPPAAMMAPARSLAETGRGTGPGIGPGSAGGTSGGAVGGVTGGIVGGLAAPPLREQVEQLTLNAAPAAGASELGELFEYRLTDRVTIRRNESALVPILQADVSADRVSLWNNSMATRPRRAVWLTNSSQLTLDAGSVSVVDANAFAGEGLIDTVKPGERRLLSYATDLGVIVSAANGEASGRTLHVRIAEGVLVQKVETRESRTYTIRNQDRDTRSVVIEHPVRPDWKLTGTVVPIESTVTVHRFQTAVPAGETRTISIDEARLGETQYAVTDVTEEHLKVFAESGDRTAALESALQPVFEKRRETVRLDADIAARQTETETIIKDQTRLRENMKALERSAGERRLLERYTRQLDAQETRLDVLKGELATLRSQRQSMQRDLNELIRRLRLDVAF